MGEVEYLQVEDLDQRAEAGSLIRQYLRWLNGILQRDYGMAFDVDAMVESDLSDSHKFHPPDGRFYLARQDHQKAGVGCLKKLDEGVGEIQRMFVAPPFRGKGIGRAIAERLIHDARAIGYRRLKLESLEFLSAAHALYHSLGFREMEPYAHNSMEAFQSSAQLDQYYSITVFMQLDL